MGVRWSWLGPGRRDLSSRPAEWAIGSARSDLSWNRRELLAARPSYAGLPLSRSRCHRRRICSGPLGGGSLRYGRLQSRRRTAGMRDETDVVLGLPPNDLRSHPELHLGRVRQLFPGVDEFRLLMGGPQAVALWTVDHLAAKRRCLVETVFLCAGTASMKKRIGKDDRESCSETSP